MSNLENLTERINALEAELDELSVLPLTMADLRDRIRLLERCEIARCEREGRSPEVYRDDLSISRGTVREEPQGDEQ